MKKEKASLFVDGSNLFFAQKNLGWHVDGAKILKLAQRDHNLQEGHWYQGLSEDDDRTYRFLDALSHLGYCIHSKPVEEFKNVKSGKIVQKSNLDVDIITDMFATQDLYETLILVSGDGDFLRALDYLRARGKKIKILSTKSVMSKDLRDTFGTNYTDLRDLRSELEKERG